MKIDLLMVDTFEDSELELEKNYIYFWKKRKGKKDVLKKK